MKKQNPIYLFTFLLSLGVVAFVLFMFVSVLKIPVFVVISIFFLLIVGFFMMIAARLNNGFYEKRFERLKECEECKTIIPKASLFCPSCGADLESRVICEYCGHSNKAGASVCDKCKGLIE